MDGWAGGVLMASRVPMAARRAFEELGEDAATAAVLASMMGRRELRLDEITKAAGVGVVAARRALTTLEARGWVLAQRIATGKRGNPPMGYTLAEHRRVLLDYYQRQAHREVERRFKVALRALGG